MADNTPTPAPTTPNPQTAAMPQGDMGSQQQQPQPSQPDVSQVDNAVPTTPDQSTDGAPAPAAAQAPARILPRRGLMHSVLVGALKGADDAMKATGKAVAVAAQNTQTGQRIRENNILMKKQQQDQQIAAQKAKEESTAALDTHQEAQLRVNSATLDNMHKVAENKQIESLYPEQTEEEHLKLVGMVRSQNDADRKFLTDLEDAGVHLDTSHFAKGNPFAQLTDDHAKAIAAGEQWGLSNGLTGDDADLAFVSNAELANTVLPHDLSVVTDWNLDPKTGVMNPVYSTLKAGENTALDAVIAHDSGMDKFNQKQDMYQKQAETRQKLAQARQEEATAQLNEAQAKALQEMGVNIPQGYVPDVNNFTLSATNLQQKLTSQGVKVPGNYGTLYAIGHYDADPKTLTTTLRRGVGQMTRDQAIAYIRTFINPNYDDATYDAVKNMEKEFADTRPNTAGGNLTAFNTATLHLGQLFDASVALQNNDVTALNKIANDIGVQYAGQSAPAIYDAIKGALVGELGKTFKGAAADIPERDDISANLSRNNAPGVLADLSKQYAHLMLSKAAAQIAQYYAYKGALPPRAIDPLAQQVYQRMGIDTNEIYPAGSSAPVGSSGNPNPVPNASKTVPPGKYAAKDAQGNVVGYADDPKGTNYHAF